MPLFSRSGSRSRPHLNDLSTKERVMKDMTTGPKEGVVSSTDPVPSGVMQTVNGRHRYPGDTHDHGKEAMHIFFNTQEERIKGTCANFLKRWGVHIWEDTNYFRDPSQKLDSALYAPMSTHYSVTQKFSSYWYGHATNIFEIPVKEGFCLRVITDPVEGHLNPLLYPRRTRPGSAFEDINLESLDVCLISHNHRDHVDDATLKKLARRNSSILMIIPKDLTRLMRSYGFTRIVELDWWEKQPLTVLYGGQLAEFSIHAVPAKHWSGRTPFDGHKTGFNGYVIQSEGMDGDVYFAGDTALMSNTEDVPHRQMLSERYNIRYSFQPGGPDEVRRYMETTHQSSADALLMHMDFALAWMKKNPNPSFSESVAAITTVFMHTKTYKLGNLHIDDTDTSLARVLLALKDTGKQRSLARVNLKQHELHVLDELLRVKELHSISDEDWSKAIAALEAQVKMPKIGETTALGVDSNSVRQPSAGPNDHSAAGVLTQEQGDNIGSTSESIAQSPLGITYRDVCTNYRALRRFDAITQSKIHQNAANGSQGLSIESQSLLDGSDGSDRNSRFARDLIMHLLGDYQNKTLGRLTRHHLQRANALAAQIRTAHTLAEIRNALNEHSNIEGVSYRPDGHYMTLLNYAHWICDCEAAIDQANQSNLAAHEMIQRRLLSPLSQTPADWGYRIAAPLAVPALMLLLGLTKIAYAGAKHPSFVLGTAVAAAALAVMHKMIPMLFATLPMMLGMVAGGIVFAALIGFSIKGLAQLFPNAASEQAEHAAADPAAAPAAEWITGM